MAAVRRLATDFEGITNPDTTSLSVAPLANGTGAMGGIQRTSGGISGQAGDVFAEILTPVNSTLFYGSRSGGFEAPVAGAEILFRPREGTPSPGGGYMPGIRLTMDWSSGLDEAGLFLNLQGDDVPGPMVDAQLDASHAVGGVQIIDDTYDLTTHDWFGWHRLTWRPSGAWELAVYEGAVLASGNLPAASIDDPASSGLAVNLVSDNFSDGGGGPGVFNGAGALVDNLFVWIVDLGPVVRMYPRDDGRGMSSAPRIYPVPKGRSRIVGGYQ